MTWFKDLLKSYYSQSLEWKLQLLMLMQLMEYKVWFCWETYEAILLCNQCIKVDVKLFNAVYIADSAAMI